MMSNVRYLTKTSILAGICAVMLLVSPQFFNLIPAQAQQTSPVTLVGKGTGSVLCSLGFMPRLTLRLQGHGTYDPATNLATITGGTWSVSSSSSAGMLYRGPITGGSFGFGNTNPQYTDPPFSLNAIATVDECNGTPGSPIRITGNCGMATVITLNDAQAHLSGNVKCNNPVLGQPTR